MGFPPNHANDEEYELGVPREDEGVVGWRLEVLRELGVSEALAEMVAPTRTDVHFVERLIAGGCEPNMAVRIAL